ncbi:MAG: valine--tRNA ligase [Candidatus Bathyarchaeota archaeon]|jgi:valyl-tRNA synthetase
MKSQLPKEFDIQKIEKKWQKKWIELGVYRFNWDDDTAPTFTVDTPPPYPSGEFHMGNVLNWTYFDTFARYKRMRGYNVHFPQGWDCHGLGIEVEVEREHKIRKRDVSPSKFRRWCEETVEKYIAIMKTSIIRMGCSVDWSTEYRTMDPNYWKLTQLSFIMSYKKGFIYRGTHPVNWCPRCETAIADAEVDYVERNGKLLYIKFPFENSSEYMQIATTRPELMPACVAIAVHPTDDRYLKHKGKKILVPLTDRVVEVIPDEMVDPSFGSGIVMICTYGDKADVKTVLKNKLPATMILTENGRINKKGGSYAGLSAEEARKAIIKDLNSSGYLETTKNIRQEIGLCERCGTPVEILEREQWFFKTRMLTDQIVRKANEINWYPTYMKTRLTDWARSLDWDWVISRQRLFGTPIPIWYCKKCREQIVAEESWVPIDPKTEKPRIETCPKCGGSEFTSETDIFDTWMDSSITCAVHAGWPKREDWRRLFPADVHPSGIDIIRTWAYYLMVRHLALFNEKPYKSCLINGMVLGPDGRKMSKSLKNYMAAPEIIDKYGADSARQWAAAGGTTGSDIPFRTPDVQYGWRFLIKLWNAARFIDNHLETFTPTKNPPTFLEPLDKWILSKAENTTVKVTEALEKCQFNIALEEIRNFTWHILCDQYIEAVKDRLYKPQKYGEDKKTAAQYTLHRALHRVLQLIAPIAPHISEEIYQKLYAEEKPFRSIHLTSWPTANESLINEDVEAQGDLIMAIIQGVRREKASKRFPLNKEIKRLKIYTKDDEKARMIREGRDDISGTCKIINIQIIQKQGEGKNIEQYKDIRFALEN